MNTKKIDDLIERYLAAETSHEEEAQLATFLRSEGVQDEYLFILEMLESKSPVLSADDEEAVSAIDRRKKTIPLYWIGSAVASVLLLIGVTSLFNDDSIENTPKYKTEIPDNENTVSLLADPEIDNLLASAGQERAYANGIATAAKLVSHTNTPVTLDDDAGETTDERTDAPDSHIEKKIKATNTTNHSSDNSASAFPRTETPSSGKKHNALSLSLSGGTANQTVASTLLAEIQPAGGGSATRAAKEDSNNPIVMGKHYIPWSIGLNARYDLSKHWSVGTGIVYTNLKSELTSYRSDKISIQRLHYVGVPIKLEYKIYSWNNVHCYTNIGGMAEKCVYATNDGDTFTVPELQFSVNASAGIEYNIDNLMSVYFEPGASYYFDNNDNVKSFRKASPFTINLAGGLRFRINDKKE